jgi:hypothetical protein
MKRPRWNHAPALKTKVALAALTRDKTLAEIAQQSDVHPNQITLIPCGRAAKRVIRGSQQKDDEPKSAPQYRLKAPASRQYLYD